jgi:lactoylglutathione lyase
MIPIRDLFESHLNVADLERSVHFYSDLLGLPHAHLLEDHRVPSFGSAVPAKPILGLWETGNSPQRMSLQIAFEVSPDDLLASSEVLQKAGITPLEFAGDPTNEPVVLGWMPAVAVYFRDPDGNLLEFLSMLPQNPRPGLGVVPWSSWPS